MWLDPESARTLGRWIAGIVLVAGLALLALLIAIIARWMRRPGAGRRRRLSGSLGIALLLVTCPTLVGVAAWESSTVPELRAELGTRRWDDAAAVTTLAYHPHGALLAAGAADGTVSLWRTGDGQLLRTLTSDLRPVASVAFSPDGALVAATGPRGVRAWRVEDGREVPIADGTAPGLAAAFAPDGYSLLVADTDGAAHSWQLADGTFRRSPAVAPAAPAPSPVRAAAFSPDRATLATYRADGEVQIRAVADGRIVWGLQVAVVQSREHCALAFSPDGRFLAATSAHDGWLWQAGDGALVGRWDAWSVRYQGLAFSPDGRTLAEGINQGAELRRVRDQLPTRSARWHAGGWAGEYRVPVAALAFSPDGRTLASGSSDGVVRLWHARRPIR